MRTEDRKRLGEIQYAYRKAPGLGIGAVVREDVLFLLRVIDKQRKDFEESVKLNRKTSELFDGKLIMDRSELERLWRLLELIGKDTVTDRVREPAAELLDKLKAAIDKDCWPTGGDGGP